MDSGLADVLAEVVTHMGGTPREGQVLMAEAVEKAFISRSHLVVQAGTGTGKSMAYLIAAARQAQREGPVVIATATLALQRQLVERELPRLEAAGIETTWSVLKGRHNYVCRLRLNDESENTDHPQGSNDRMSDLEAQARAVQEWAATTLTGDRDDLSLDVDARVWRSVSVSSSECVGEHRCPFGTECFAGQARIDAAASDIVVTNHAMVAMDARSEAQVLPMRSAIIVDEAHELIDRISGALSCELSRATLERMTREVGQFVDDGGSLLQSVDLLTGAFEELVDTQQSSQGRVREWAPSMILALAGVRDSTHSILTEISTPQGVVDLWGDEAAVGALSRARASLLNVHDICGRLLALSDSDVCWWSVEGDWLPTLHCVPLSVGDHLEELLFAKQPVVLTSATLMVDGSFESALEAWGLDSSTECLDVGSSFHYPEQGILYSAAHLPAPGRDGPTDEMFEEMAELVFASGGRALLLFSSWRGVERAADFLNVRLAPELESGAVGELLVHQRGASLAPLVHRFVTEPATVLMGTISLWQGIDVPGDACVLVVIDRIPFPHPEDPLVSARQEAVEAGGGSGFYQVALAKASLLLAQGAGRLIRSSSDRGVVAVMDSRLSKARYGRTLVRTLPPLWFTTDKAVVMSALERLRADL